MATNRKNPHAVALGRLGGSVKTPKGLATMTKKRRMEIVRKGAAMRKAQAAARKKEAE
jgi:hypothetical protein